MGKRSVFTVIACAAMILGMLGQATAERYYGEFDYVTENTWGGAVENDAPVAPPQQAAPSPGPAPSPSSATPAPAPGPAPSPSSATPAPAPARNPQPKPDFSISISPKSKSVLNRIFIENMNSVPSKTYEVESYTFGFYGIQVDREARYTVTVKSENGFSGDVELSVEGIPSGAIYSIPVSVQVPATGRAVVSFVVTTAKTTPKGEYTLTVKGANGGAARSDSATLSVTEQREFVFVGVTGPVYDGGMSGGGGGGNGMTRYYTVDYTNPVGNVDGIPYLNYTNPKLREEQKTAASWQATRVKGDSPLNIVNILEKSFVNTTNKTAETTMNLVKTGANAIETGINAVQNIVSPSLAPAPVQSAAAQIASAAVSSAKISNSTVLPISTPTAASAPAPQPAASSGSGTLISPAAASAVQAPRISTTSSSPAPTSAPKTSVAPASASLAASSKTQPAAAVTNLTTAVQKIANTTKSPTTASIANLALLTLHIIGIGFR